ncbi:MAG: hypothetical protein KAR47_14580, partial [Planctomycetes bacterium]|nr:hypothetical protein [Planctomycetota bacterium]
GVFWLNTTGYIDSSQETAPIAQQTQLEDTDAKLEKSLPLEAKKVTPEDTKAGKVVEEITAEQDKTVEGETEEIAPVETAENNLAKYLILKHAQAVIIVRICNFALILAATLYSLVLLISLKISLVGRLGGISHISRAFFLTLFALVILMPWQFMF